MASSVTRLVKKPNSKSVIWNYFGVSADDTGRPIDGSEKKPICRTCNKQVPSKDANTSNMFAHLRDVHPLLYKEAMKTKEATTRPTSSTQRDHKQPTLQSVIEHGMHYDPKSVQAQQFNHAVAYFLAKDMQPYNTVEKPGFKAMVAKLNPRYKIPSRKHFAEQEIPRLYNSVKETNVTPKLKEIEYFSATTDFWTSQANHPYLSYTIHFVDKEWNLVTFCLETVPLFEDHCGENIVEAISDIHANWNLSSDNLVVTTTDNGSNFVAGFHTKGWTRLSCFGHNLDLAVGKGLDNSQIQKALGRCRSLVECFSRSWKKSRDLQEKQTQLGLKNHKLIGAVSTRWGSTYEMIERILEQQQAIAAVLAEDRKYWHKMPTESEFSTLEAVAAVLKPLSVLTDALSGDEVTASALRPLLKHIVGTHLVQNDEDSVFVSEMKERIKCNLESRYKSACASQLIDKSTFMDPRFKVQYVHDKELTVAEIEAEMLTVLSRESSEDSQATDATDQLEPEPPRKKRKGLGAVLANIPKSNESTKEVSKQDKIKKELQMYMDQPCIDTDSKPLKWWKLNSSFFPVMAKLAKKYLSIPATSVRSERVFSSGGYIVNNFRSRLLPEHVNLLVFLANNLKD